MAVDESIYPRMVYQAFENDRGQYAIRYLVCDDAKAYDDLGGGWYPGPNEAAKAYEDQQNMISEAATYRAYEDRNMGRLAQLEAAAADDATHRHVPEVVEKRRPGRPRKVVA